MKKLVHPNLIQLFEVIDYDEGDKLYMSKLKFNKNRDFSILYIFHIINAKW